MLAKLQVPPGIIADGSFYSASGRWTDGNRVRFRLGSPETIRGWVRTSIGTFAGTCRALHPWATLSGASYLGVGTSLKYYIQAGGAFYDITPIRRTATVSLSVTDGSSILTVTDATHGAIAGDFVTFSGSLGLGGIDAAVINTEHRITSVVGVNAYTITLSAAATSDATESVTAAYQINTGLDTVVTGTGWGAGLWGGLNLFGSDTGWGSAASLAAPGDQIRLWSHDNFGQDLIINPRDGGIYYWSNTGGLSSRAVPVSSLPGAVAVPTQAREIMVSDKDRRLIAFGCTGLDNVVDPMLIRWSETELPQSFLPTEENSAGDLRIPQGSEFITALETRNEILVWSDSALHSLRYVGAPFIYGISALGSASIIGPNAKVALGDQVAWMGLDGFYIYDGRIQQIPCPVQDKVFLDLNLGQRYKVFAGANSTFDEIWWFYPSSSSSENDLYVAFDRKQGAWHYGELARSAWADRGLEDFPRAAAFDGHIYWHEYGYADGSQNPPVRLDAWIQSGPLELEGGNKFSLVQRVIPDVWFAPGNTSAIQMRIQSVDFPGQTVNWTEQEAQEVLRLSTTAGAPFTDQLWVRLRGRALAVRVEEDPDTANPPAWRLGTVRLDVRQDGRRS